MTRVGISEPKVTVPELTPSYTHTRPDLITRPADYRELIPLGMHGRRPSLEHVCQSPWTRSVSIRIEACLSGLLMGSQQPRERTDH